jgi:hypothetical protein
LVCCSPSAACRLLQELNSPAAPIFQVTLPPGKSVQPGKTLTNEIDARFDLDSEASPGWSEFNPDQGFDDDFGDNDT